MKILPIIFILIFSFNVFGQYTAKVNEIIAYYNSGILLKDLLQSLDKKLQKEEFESKAEYKKRLNEFLGDIYIGDRKDQNLAN